MIKDLFGILVIVIVNVINCVARQYLDYENCKCRKKLIYKLVEKCSENIDENRMIYNETLNDYKNVYNSCAMYIVLFFIVFLISIGFSSAYFYFYWHLNRSNIETLIYQTYKWNIKSRPYYFFCDMINIKNFNSNFLNINKI